MTALGLFGMMQHAAWRTVGGGGRLGGDLGNWKMSGVVRTWLQQCWQEMVMESMLIFKEVGMHVKGQLGQLPIGQLPLGQLPLGTTTPRQLPPWTTTH